MMLNRNVIISTLLVVQVFAAIRSGAQADKNNMERRVKANPFLHAKSKEITSEFRCAAEATVLLQNIMRKVCVRTSNDHNLRLVATVYYHGETSFTDSEWLQRLGINIKGNENKIEVLSGEFPIPKNPVSNGRNRNAHRLDTIFNSITVFDSSGNAVGRRSSSTPTIILYIPDDASLNIESKYADITLEGKRKKVTASISNGALTMMHANELYVTSAYATIDAGTIRHAEADIRNGKFKAKKINSLHITSKNSTVNVVKMGFVHMNSEIDEFSADEVKEITGKKAYGNFEVRRLTGSIDLSGVNADIKISTIDTTVSTVKISNRYAALQLPVSGLKNYTVSFEGSSKNIHTPFEKTAVTNNSFKAAIGKANGRPTVFQLSCHNCSIGF